MPSETGGPHKKLAKQPFEALQQVKPAHTIGAPLLNSQELAGNREMSDRAQSRATVHQLQPGITGKGIGRHGRRGRAR